MHEKGHLAFAIPDAEVAADAIRACCAEGAALGMPLRVELGRAS